MFSYCLALEAIYFLGQFLQRFPFLCFLQHFSFLLQLFTHNFNENKQAMLWLISISFALKMLLAVFISNKNREYYLESIQIIKIT